VGGPEFHEHAHQVGSDHRALAVGRDEAVVLSNLVDHAHPVAIDLEILEQDLTTDARMDIPTTFLEHPRPLLLIYLKLGILEGETHFVAAHPSRQAAPHGEPFVMQVPIDKLFHDLSYLGVRYSLKMKTILRDRNEELVEAWKGWFKDEPVLPDSEIVIEQGDIFDGPGDCIVSPANSFGIMNGGIDQAYTDRFGIIVQERIQKILRDKYWGELPVGCAVIVPTDDPEFPWCASAPTMRVPESVSNTLNAYHAFRAVRLAVERHNKDPRAAEHPNWTIKSILCPGLGTATGKLDYDLCARQMLCAYRAPDWPGDCSENFTTPWAMGRFMRGEADMAGVSTIHQTPQFKVIQAD